MELAGVTQQAISSWDTRFDWHTRPSRPPSFAPPPPVLGGSGQTFSEADDRRYLRVSSIESGRMTRESGTFSHLARSMADR